MDEYQENMKLALFGGTFNPPHIAHLIGAELARGEFQIDKILFTPTYIPPHKQAPDVSSEARKEMLEIAIKDNPYFQILDLEIKRREVSYSIDTIREIKREYPVCFLYLIMGTDQAGEFWDWKEPESILELVKFIIIKRPDYDKNKIDKRLLSKSQFLELSLDISSSVIRERVTAGKTIRYLVPEGVRDYIIANGLYQM